MSEHALTAARREKGMTQATCALRAGCKRWMINRIEKGERRPSRDLAVKLQEVTGVDAAILLGLPPQKEAAQ